MGFGFGTTTDEVLAGIVLSGRLAVVTGASGGLGEETARALAAHGATVVLAVRNFDKGERAAAAIRAAVPGARIELQHVDLASLASVRAFTDRYLANHKRLDMLIANAGVDACPFWHTEEGFEYQFGTNHLGHFVLVNRLVPALLAASPSRVVVVASSAHRFGDVDLDDPGFERTPYRKWIAYGRSKTANVLFAVELDRRLRDRGVRAFAVHPGVINTELERHLSPEDYASVVPLLPKAKANPRKSIPAGAATSVWAATSPDLAGRGGLYLEDCGIAGPGTPDDWPGVLPYATDPSRARALWALSEKLVKEEFIF